MTFKRRGDIHSLLPTPWRIAQCSLALLNRSPTNVSCCQVCLRDVTTSRARDALLYVCPISPNAWIQVKKSDWASLLSWLAVGNTHSWKIWMRLAVIVTWTIWWCGRRRPYRFLKRIKRRQTCCADLTHFRNDEPVAISSAWCSDTGGDVPDVSAGVMRGRCNKMKHSWNIRLKDQILAFWRFGKQG